MATKNRPSWATRLVAAEKRGKFTEREKDWATDWRSCAIGEKHDFPSSQDWSNEGPEDETESRLGMAFMYAVENDEVTEARRLYAEILVLPISEGISG